MVKDGDRNLIFIRNLPGTQGYVMVVKAVLQKDELFVTSFRRLSADEAKRDREILRLKAKEK